MSAVPETFERFSLNERIQHILMFVSFTLLALTGLPQKYSSLEWAKTMTDLLGGLAALRLIHRVNALVLGGVFIYHVIRGIYGLWTRRSHFDMLPRPKDAFDLLHNIANLLGIRSTRPRFERFSYIEKFDYWAVFWGMAIMAGSGLILWFPTQITQIFPGLAVPVAKAAHSDEALLAISAIALWHLYNTHLNPRIFPLNTSIFTGRVSRHEMMVEHPLEYERRTGETVPDEMLSSRPARSRLVLAISVVLGVVMVGLFATMITWALNPPAPVLPAPGNAPILHTSLLQPPAGPVSAAEPIRLWNANQSARPSADFTAEAIGGTGRREGRPPLTVDFANRSVGESATFLWDFGDGATSSEANPQHTYNQCPGSKEMCTIRLTVCGPGGCDTMIKADHLWVSAKAAEPRPTQAASGTPTSATPSASLPTENVLDSTKKIGDYGVTLISPKGAPKVGSNDLEAILLDADGRPITDATVAFDIDMATITQGAKVVQAKMSSPGHYAGTGNFAKAGSWRVIVQVTRPGQRVATSRFIFTVVQ